MSTYFIDNLYPSVYESLSDKKNQEQFKRGIDVFLGLNIDKLNVSGPLKKVAFPQRSIDELIECLGLNAKDIQTSGQLVKKDRNMKADYTICTNPLYVSIALATRYFILSLDNNTKNRSMHHMKEDEDQIKRCIYYMAISHYCLLVDRYFKRCEPNENIMEYAISQMIEKNRIRQTGSMLDTIYVTTYDCYTFYKDRLRIGTDDTFVRYINDVRTRLNSIMRNISKAYYEAFNNKQYLRSETEDMSDESYYEADSNSQFIDRTSNKVVQKLVTNGPDMKLIEIAAMNNLVSVSDLRNYVVTLCTEKQIDELRETIEALLILFFSSESSRKYSTRDIGTNKFLLFALQIYAKSNTKNTHILKIKYNLDKWIKELHVYERSGAKSTINNHRRAIYMFLVETIMKLN